MTRRSLFALSLAPFLGKLSPQAKPKALSAEIQEWADIQLIHLRIAENHARYLHGIKDSLAKMCAASLDYANKLNAASSATGLTKQQIEKLKKAANG